jgi:protein gp37
LRPYLPDLGWVIAGGESSQVNAAREFRCEWARQLRDECAGANVPYFIKQLGTKVTERSRQMRLTDRHGGDWNDWPRDLGVRQMPVFRTLEGQP